MILELNKDTAYAAYAPANADKKETQTKILNYGIKLLKK